MKIKKTLCGVLLTTSLLAGCNSGNVPTVNSNNALHQSNSHTTKESVELNTSITQHTQNSVY